MFPRNDHFSFDWDVTAYVHRCIVVSAGGLSGEVRILKETIHPLSMLSLPLGLILRHTADSLIWTHYDFQVHIPPGYLHFFLYH